VTIPELEQYLEEALEGLTPLEQALEIAEALREVWPEGEWVIEMKPGDEFTVTRVR